MLQTQVSYWANQEQKRHNKAQEQLERSKQLIDLENAVTQRISAKAQESNANINAVNALTQQENLKVAQEQLDINRMSAQASASQAETAAKQLLVSQQQARTAEMNAVTNRMGTAADVQLKQEQQANMELQNNFYVPAKVVSTVKEATGIVSALKSGVTKLLTRK